MDTALTLSLIAVNAFVLIACIATLKNARANRLLKKAKKMTHEGNNPNALYYLDKALKVSPQNIQALSHKAVVLRDMGETHYSEAIECYNKALILADNGNTLAAIYYHLGALYCTMGKYTEAKDCYDRAMSDENINDKEFWNNYGILYYQLNDNTQALLCFNKALAIDSAYRHAKQNKDTLTAEIANQNK